jgi:hypothetical protein
MNSSSEMFDSVLLIITAVSVIMQIYIIFLVYAVSPSGMKNYRRFLLIYTVRVRFNKANDLKLITKLIAMRHAVHYPDWSRYGAGCAASGRAGMYHPRRCQIPWTLWRKHFGKMEKFIRLLLSSLSDEPGSVLRRGSDVQHD